MSVLRTFHNIVTNQNLTFQDKAQSLLTTGLEIFNLDIGIISHIDGDTYTAQFVACHNDELAPGSQFSLGNTYCVHTLNADNALGFHHAGKSEIATHPCYQDFQLESYIGAPIKVEGKTIGTVNFSSIEPSLPFPSEYIDYIELFAQWLGAEIARQSSIDKLEKNNQTLSKLEQAAHIGTWELELESNQLSWSEQASRIFELNTGKQPDLEGALGFFQSESSRQAIEAASEAAIKNSTPWNLELDIITAQGNPAWIATQGHAEVHNGRCIRLFGTVQDITDSVKMKQQLAKQKEEAELMLNERSKLFAKISHELRNPLNGIVGMLNAAINEKETANIKNNLAVALRSSDLLLSIINEVLDYSKISHGELNLEPSHFRLRSIFTDLISLYNPLCQSKSIKLCYNINLKENVSVYFDSTRLSQIISNLLSNAIKFTDKGDVSLLVDAKQIEKQIALSIKVSDSGIGMKPDTLTALFKPFSQGTSHITQKYGGTGLGLSIVKELIDMMQGEIKVQSEYGKGSGFTISMSLPLSDKNISTTITPTELEQIDASSLKILVVDDNEINRIVMQSCLAPYHINPDTALDGKDAIEKCQKTTYDLIFMDCIMPVMDGWQASNYIRSEKLIPESAIIAALTANTSESDKLACKQAGMNLFMTKPINPAAIHQALSTALKGQRLSQTE